MNVDEALTEKGIQYTPKGSDYLVRCINPEHDDASPSMRIDKVSGVFNCFSCSYKGNIFEEFSIHRDIISEQVYSLRNKIKDIQLETDGLSMPDNITPFARMHRDISKSTYKHFEAFTEAVALELIVFPLRDITGRIYAFQSRHLESKAPGKYLVSPAGAKLQLFPAKIIPINKSLIIVEGIFDMLNLYDKGFTNVVCMFGASNIQRGTVRNLLRTYKLQGVQRIQLLLDPDTAGRKGANRIKDAIQQSTDFIVEIVRFLEEKDPGDLTEEETDKLRQHLYKEKYD